MTYKKEMYYERLLDPIIRKYLKVFGAICIQGPKWCVKTWTSQFHSSSSFYVGDSRNNFGNRHLAKINPTKILEGKTPRLIDEWQEYPPIWDVVKFEVDNRGLKGQFILTGSSTPEHKGLFHSGIGRIATLQLRPMSLFESKDSLGQISLKDLINDNFENTTYEGIELNKIINLIIRGGWPDNIEVDDKYSYLAASNYVNTFLTEDLDKISNTKFDKNKLQKLLKSLARNNAITVSINKLIDDIKTNENETIDKKTIYAYLDILNRSFIVDNLQPFSLNIRSNLRIKQNEKRLFVDPSLAAALLNVNNESLQNDLNTLGFLFENLVLRDLKVYAQSNEWNIYHYQDYNDNELDAVIELKNGEWVAIEIKLGWEQVDKASEKLVKFSNKLEKQKATKPKKLIVITGTGKSAYLREDNVYVVPIGLLKN